MGWIVVISGGPGGADYITESARRKASECDVLIGNKDQLNTIETHDTKHVHEESGIESILDLLEKHRGEKTGIMVTGDAGIYSLAQKIIDRFGKDSIIEVIPGISSIQVAFARIKESWLNVRVFSFHGRALEGFEEILEHERVAILCDREHNSKVILGKLMDYGLFDGSREIYVCQELTLPEERVIRIGSPEDVAKIEVNGKEIVVILSL